MIGRAGIVVAATEAAAARRGTAMKTAAPTTVVATATTTVKAASATASMRAATTAVTAATVLSECGTRRGNERNPKKRRKEEFKKCRPCHVYALHQQPVEPTKAPRKSCSAPSYQIGLTWSAVGCNPVNCYPINSPTEPRECPRSI
jgi:hypothetical protein